MSLEGFAVEETKEKTTIIEKIARVLVGIDRMQQQTRINLACYLASAAIYLAIYLYSGFLGIFIFGVVSLLLFEKIPYLTMIALSLIFFSGIWMMLDITGLGIKLKAGMDWLFGQPFTKPLK